MRHTGGVARLLPTDFDLGSLEHSERRVCEAFVAGLDDSWTVVPSVPILVNGNDSEIDIVLASPTQGVVLVEVKGGIIAVQGGRWVQNGRQLRRSPVEQVMAAKHQLIARMRQIGVDLSGMFMCHVVALPDAGGVPAEGLGPDAPREIVFAKPDLAQPALAIARVQREQGPVPLERIGRFLAALRPDIVLDGDEGRAEPAARQRIDDATRLHLTSAKTLDSNQRVLVTGGAGTGKTWLVLEWARRAVARGERTLVVCFNKPIAEHLQRVLEDTGVTVGTYHDVLVRLLEPHGFVVEGQVDHAYWEVVPTAALVEHADAVGTPFDTIVVDEGQDLRPHWLASLEQLLDPAGPQRLLVVADPAQAIYVSPWQPPANATTMGLEYNLRSSYSVASVVKRLGGPIPLPGAPGRNLVRFVKAGGPNEVRKRVRDLVAELTTQQGVPLSQIAVMTLRTSVRDGLLAHAGSDLPLARWEDRSEETALCETVHRTKGLERTAVILIDIGDAPDPMLVYVGASRAMWSLTLVGHDALANAAGVTPH